MGRNRSVCKLGVNIDHVATLREVRGGRLPVPSLAAVEAEKGGADGITVHLREDRRHIQDQDLFEIKKAVNIPLNLEMALAPGIVRIALRLSPEKVCFVPEKRRELTTEGGLNARAKETMLGQVIQKLHKSEIQVSLFIEPVFEQIEAAWRVKADAVEIHTGVYANAGGARRKKELIRIRQAVREALSLGLKVHAGHGLDYGNVEAIAKIPGIQELNIGHSIVSRSVFVGMREAVAEMKRLLGT